MKHTLKSVRTLAATLIAFGSLAGGTNAAIIVAGNPSTGTGTITFTQDITFLVTSSGSFDRLIFDEWVVNDGSLNFGNIAPASLSFSLNGGSSQSAAGLGLADNLAFNFGAITDNDGYFFLDPIAVVSGDSLTIEAGVWSIPAIPNFNPDSVGTFTGELYLFQSNGTRLSLNTSFVPEPSSTLLFGLGALGLVTRRRRTN